MQCPIDQTQLQTTDHNGIGLLVTATNKALCDVLIDPPGAGGVSGFDVSKAKDLFQTGYHYTKENFKPEDFRINPKRP